MLSALARRGMSATLAEMAWERREEGRDGGKEEEKRALD